MFACGCGKEENDGNRGGVIVVGDAFAACSLGVILKKMSLGTVLSSSAIFLGGGGWGGHAEKTVLLFFQRSKKMVLSSFFDGGTRCYASRNDGICVLHTLFFGGGVPKKRDSLKKTALSSFSGRYGDLVAEFPQTVLSSRKFPKSPSTDKFENWES